MHTSFSVLAEPVPAPRQTRSDRWNKRPCVERYRAWCDEVRLACTGNPLQKIAAETVIGIYCFFHLPVPESWPEKKKQEHYGKLHRGKPDADNLTKGVADALFGEDKAVAIMQGVKFYVEKGDSPRADVFLLISPAITATAV